jgi:hypothetical protein
VLGHVRARLVLLSQAFLVLGRRAIRVMGGAGLGVFGVASRSRGSGWLVHVVSSCLADVLILSIPAERGSETLS